MPAWIVGKVEDGLRRSGKTLEQADILILGIAYKKNIDDMRESPAVAIMELLKQAGSKISYSDPFVPVFPPMRNYFFDLSTTPLTESSVGQFDVVLLTTDHDCFDYDLILKCAKLIVDTRGRYAMCEAANVISA